MSYLQLKESCSMINRAIQPAILPIGKIKLPPLQELTLENGITLHVINNNTTDLIKVDLIFNTGAWYEEKMLVSYITSELLTKGSTSMSGDEIAEKLDYYGSSIDNENGIKKNIYNIYSLSKFLDKTLSITADCIKNPTFPQKELDLLLKQTYESLILYEKKNQNEACKLFDELLYGKNHPIGRYVKSSEFPQITRDDILTFYNNGYNSKNVRIMVTGKVTNDVINIINNHFGKDNWGNGCLPISQKFPIETATNKRKIVDKKEATQSSIILGSFVLNYNDPDFFKLKVLCQVLGGDQISSRLGKKIREEKGYTYGIFSYLRVVNMDGILTIKSDIKKDKVNESIDDIYKEIERLKTELIEDDELIQNKNSLLSTISKALENAFSISYNYNNLICKNLPISTLQKQIDDINSVNAEELRTLAQKYLKRENFIEVVVG